MGYTMFINNDTKATQETVRVGSANFILPEGYTMGVPNNYGDVNITNGDISFFLLEYPDSSLQKHVDDYQESIGENQTLSISNFTCPNNMVVVKAVNDQHPNTVHYWYVYHNKTYSVYSWDYGKLDNTVKELIQNQYFS